MSMDPLRNTMQLSTLSTGKKEVVIDKAEEIGPGKDRRSRRNICANLSGLDMAQ